MGDSLGSRLTAWAKTCNRPAGELLAEVVDGRLHAVIYVREGTRIESYPLTPQLARRFVLEPTASVPVDDVIPEEKQARVVPVPVGLSGVTLGSDYADAQVSSEAWRASVETNAEARFRTERQNPSVDAGTPQVAGRQNTAQCDDNAAFPLVRGDTFTLSDVVVERGEAERYLKQSGSTNNDGGKDSERTVEGRERIILGLVLLLRADTGDKYWREGKLNKYGLAKAVEVE